MGIGMGLEYCSLQNELELGGTDDLKVFYYKLTAPQHRLIMFLYRGGCNVLMQQYNYITFFCSVVIYHITVLNSVIKVLLRLFMCSFILALQMFCSYLHITWIEMEKHQTNMLIKLFIIPVQSTDFNLCAGEGKCWPNVELCRDIDITFTF